MASYVTRIASGAVLAMLHLAGAQAQLRPQLIVNAGPAYSLTTMQRTAGTPTGFRAANTFGLAGELRLAWPLALNWALETKLGLSELQPGIQYRFANGSHNSGLGMGPLLQAGLAVRRLNLLNLGSRLSLDAALGAAAGRLTTPYPTDDLHDFNGRGQPAPDLPVLVYNTRQLRRTTVLLSGDVRLRYTLTARRNLLLSLEYAPGLRPLLETRTQQLLYLDANGQPQPGGFVVRNRGSHALVQLGYGWFLGRTGEQATTRTPRYGRTPALPEEPAEDETPFFSDPPTE